MKKLLTMAAAAVVAGSMVAQESTTVEVVDEEVVPASVGSDFKSNWFISAGAGGQVFFGDHDKQRKFGERIAPALDVAVGKWVTPGIGLRLMYSGLSAKGATQNGAFQSGGAISGKPWEGYWLNESKFSFMNLHADVMFDLCNLIGGYKASRVYSCVPYAGLGFAMVLDKPHNKSVTGNVGILNAFHVSKAIDINADVRATVFNDSFDGASGGSQFEGMLSFTVGLTYKFAPRGWKSRKEVVTIREYDNDAVNDLRRQVNQLVAKNEKLEKEIANGKNVNHRVIEVVGADYLIYFPINASSLAVGDRAQLEMLAKAIKESPKDVTYMIMGYADSATGTPEINEVLSKKRAESVRECLVNEFDVPVSRLDITWKGGVGNMFYDDPALSRCVIISPKGKN